MRREDDEKFRRREENEKFNKVDNKGMKKEFFFFQSSAVTRLKFPSYFYFYVVLV
jgi:hypothetical protein